MKWNKKEPTFVMHIMHVCIYIASAQYVLSTPTCIYSITWMIVDHSIHVVLIKCMYMWMFWFSDRMCVLCIFTPFSIATWQLNRVVTWGIIWKLFHPSIWSIKVTVRYYCNWRTKMITIFISQFTLRYLIRRCIHSF